jgi:hypothetical protein
LRCDRAADEDRHAETNFAQLNRSYGRLISVDDVRKAAREWYQQDKMSVTKSNPALAGVLSYVIDEVIGQRKTRAFLFPSNTNDVRIDQLYDARLLHLLKKSISSNVEPGKRYDVFKIDYGCYVDLINTSRAPGGLFQGDGDMFINEVPPDDYRSIRRAILRPEDIINGDMHEFQHKRDGVGPHVFINLRTGLEACFGTQELFKLQEHKLYRNPGRTGLQFDAAAWTKEALEQIQQSYRSVNKKSRAKAEAKMRYVSEFVNRILIADPEAPYARSHRNATEVIKFVDEGIVAENVETQKQNENLAASGKLEIIVRPRNLSTRSLLRWVNGRCEA